MHQSMAGTIAVRERHRFDVEVMERHLTGAVEGFEGPLNVRQFKGGQSNPTFLLETPNHAYVLRRRPQGELLESAHAIDREYRVMAALAATAVPVPRMYCFCDDTTLIGTTFYVMEFVQGRTLWDLSLPDASRSERSAFFTSMCETIAALHAQDFDSLGLRGYGKPGNYMQRQIARWSKQYRASETEAIGSIDALMAWLPDHIPQRESTALVHGDFRIDNLVFHPFEPRVIAVLDWELSTLGDPLADFAYHAMLWDLPRDEMRGLQGFDLEALGIPSAEEYIQRYCGLVGMDAPSPAEWDFYVAFNLFRGAAISQGIMRRALDGSASSTFALEAGSKARALADAGWRRAQGEQTRI